MAARLQHQGKLPVGEVRPRRLERRMTAELLGEDTEHREGTELRSSYRVRALEWEGSA